MRINNNEIDNKFNPGSELVFLNEDSSFGERKTIRERERKIIRERERERGREKKVE